MEASTAPAPQIGISSCLLGEEVRFDGGHKHNRYITHSLGQYFDFTPFCPEVAIGLGIPRPPIRLAEQGDEIRVIGVADGSQDYTDRLKSYGERIAGQIGGLSGYILKKDSPSCGMERVKVYKEKMPERVGVGAFAEV
ncbi:MAG: DUF523 domain-containing protein, partial [Pseudomonadales bacterium]|nr:DUF523 domain-containing protein [Pseudomonadales bacterium]